MAAMISRLRLGLAAALFGLWMGWLIYLAVADSRRHDVVARDPSRDQPGFDRLLLSRPQFLVSNLDVIAQVDQDRSPAEVHVTEVLWPREETKWVGEKLRISNLAECRDSWVGSGRYILPLMTAGKNEFRVPPIPPSPGSPDAAKREGKPRIYEDAPEMRQQLESIQKPTQP
jgi:hypothetical protein